MKKILIVHEPKNDRVHEIAEIMKEELKQYNWLIHFKSPSDAHSPAHYLGVLIGSPENLQISECQTLGWIKKYGKVLTQKSTCLFSIGPEFVEMGPSRLLVPRKKIVADTLSSVGCAPRMIEIFSDKTTETDIRRLAHRFGDYVVSHTYRKAA